MSTFYTAPPIYNTGGWGFRGDIPTFNPTGVLDDVGETGKVSVSSSFYHVSNEDRRFKITASTSDIQYFTKENRRNVKLKVDPTFNLVGEVPRINFELSPNIENFRRKTNRFNFELQPTLTSPKSIKKELRLQIDPVFNLAKQERLATRNKINPTLEAINYFYSISDKSLIAKNENVFEANIFSASLTRDASSFANTQINYFNESYIKGKNFLKANANYFAEASLKGKNYLVLQANYFQKNFIEGKSSMSLELQSPYRIAGRFGLDINVNINNVYNSRHRVGLDKSVEIDYFRNFEKQKYSLSTSIYNPRNNSHRFKHTNTLSDLNYFPRDDFEGVSFSAISLNNIENFKPPFYKGFIKNKLSDINYFSKSFIRGFGKSRLSDINYFSTSLERFSKTNTLNTIDYNSDPVPKEAKTESSFPTGLEFPKIRYQTAEPDYTKASTGSNTYGYLQYEGIEEGNLFFYEPDTGSYQWEYFHYGIRSGIFNPCEFPETADRTLDPVQISSRSNKKDNPFWYLPDLLTVDSTIHLADGAPCQYIAQENNRYAEIFLEDGLLLLPENYTNTGQVYTI